MIENTLPKYNKMKTNHTQQRNTRKIYIAYVCEFLLFTFYSLGLVFCFFFNILRVPICPSQIYVHKYTVFIYTQHRHSIHILHGCVKNSAENKNAYRYGSAVTGRK